MQHRVSRRTVAPVFRQPSGGYLASGAMYTLRLSKASGKSANWNSSTVLSTPFLICPALVEDLGKCTVLFPPNLGEEALNRAV